MKTINIKFILIIFSIVFLTACAQTWQINEQPQYIKKDNYHLYIPNNADMPISLMYIISPDGYEKTVESYINSWKKFANKNNFIIVSPIDWNQEKILLILNEVRLEYNINKVFFSGFSNGGYNSCYFALGHRELVDAVIPMGAYCRDSDIANNQERKIPILSVVGEKDTWSRGDDFSDIKRASDNLKKIGFFQKEVLILGAGHDFDFNVEYDKIERWILDINE